MGKKILIIGNSANSYALAKKLSESHEIFVAPGTVAMKSFAECVDIREDSITELLEFSLENGIDLVLPISLKPINKAITDIFRKNHLNVFAPSQKSANMILDKAGLKKILYKLRIPTPKFGIFEKQNMAADYVKNLKNPFVIKTNDSSSAVILTSTLSAKPILDSLFAQKNQKVIIEDYIWGTPFCFYAITDGYKALPIGSSIMYKHSLEGDGGQLTSGMGACVPNYKISLENEDFLMNNVVYPLIEYIEMNSESYTGIIGINGILAEDNKIEILGCDTFFQECDCDAILNQIDTDLYELLQACVLGSFSDEYDFIKQKDIFSTSIVLSCKNKENVQNVIYGIENLDEDTLVSFYPSLAINKYLEYEANQGSVMVLTSTARTASSSTSKVYDELENINFKGLAYRTDICKPLRTTI